MSIEQRVIPLTDDFMKNKKTHDKVWSFLQTNSYITKDKERFVYITQDTNARSIQNKIKTIIEKEKEGEIIYKDSISVETVRNTLKLYEKIGFIKKAKIEDNYNRNVDCYILKQDFSCFQFIPLETLKFLVNTATENVIKIYAYLINKYYYKQSLKEYYNFTLKELCEAIGYNGEKQENKNMIKDILLSLKNNGLINYTNGYYYTDKHPVPIYNLTYVSLKVKDKI